MAADSHKSGTLETRCFGEVREVVLIGGGMGMLDSARFARERGLATRVLMAPRHAAEPIASYDRADAAFRAEGFAAFVVDDPEDATATDWHDGLDGETAMSVCYGPAWIFSEATRRRFRFGMYNYNTIPIPRYLGGAHFTWQILNDDRTAGCCIQEIVARVDRGSVLRLELSDLPETTRTPENYFREVEALGRGFLARFFDDLVTDKPFELQPFDAYEDEILYFPRLMTALNGVIDWSWSVDEIERFCRGFDTPYPGARTRLGDVWWRLSDVEVLERDPSLHPFAAGLVVRLSAEALVVAAPGGLLRVGSAAPVEATEPATRGPRLGDRFYTQPHDLSAARASRPSFAATGARRTS